MNDGPKPALPLQVISSSTQVHLGLKTALSIAVSTVLLVVGITRFFYAEMKEDFETLRAQIEARDTSAAAIAARIKTLENGGNQQVAVTEYVPGTVSTLLNEGINVPPLSWTGMMDAGEIEQLPWAHIPRLNPRSPISATPPSIYCQAPITIMADGSDESANVCLVLPDPAAAIEKIDGLETTSPIVQDLREILESGWEALPQN